MSQKKYHKLVILNKIYELFYYQFQINLSLIIFKEINKIQKKRYSKSKTLIYLSRMAGFKKVNSSKSEYPNQNIPSPFTVGTQYNEEKEQMLKKCYEKFLEFPLEHQQKIIQIIQPQPQVAIKERDQILDIINYLIEKDKTMSQSNARQRLNLIANKPKYEIIMRIFEAKFAQMSKSKEEMIKFCMRKAFKFVYDKIVSEKKQKLNKKEQKQLKNEYFGITNESEYALPFRDDSAEKTMNDDFLKKTFALNNFINDYKLFLESYDDILEKDNQKKIAILVDQILETPDENFEQGLLKIKRIPWSREILEQTKQLATFLLQKYGTINEQQMNTKPSHQTSSLNKDSNIITSTEGIFNDSSFNFQNSLATNNTLNKHKQILISYEEFKKLTLNFSKNPNFKDLATNLQRDFNKHNQSNLEQVNFYDTQFDQQAEQVLKNEPVVSNNLNASQKQLTTSLTSELNQNLILQPNNIIKENQLLQSPEIFRIQNEKNLNTITCQTKVNLEKSTSIKEEFNDTTKINSFRDKTPEPAPFKAFSSTSQFNISPIFNLNSLSQTSNPSQKNLSINQNQQINTIIEQSTNNIPANPFNLVSLQGYINQAPQTYPQVQQNNQTQSIFISPFQKPSSNILSPLNTTHLTIDQSNQINLNQNLFQGIGLNEASQQINLNNSSDNNLYQQSLLQPNNMNIIDQDSFDTNFLKLLIQVYNDYTQQQQQQQQQSQINLMNQDILGLQSLIQPSSSTQDFSMQDLSMQTKQYLQQSSNQFLATQNLLPSNEFFRERSLSFQQNQQMQLQQNLGQNSTFSSNIFSSLVNDVSLEIPKQTLLNQQEQNLLKRINQNSQFYFPLTDSQLNIQKQPESIQINQFQNNTQNEDISLKDIIKKEQQNTQKN
ncbi:hypothetical protein TTHERM_00120960 (macronuclear) [Tetrahymena thermophila SB210]|uniref:Uncharacterized protein n=1 Tax=Tetrahymena thermophila (strain SB210) TaxID=312017 RepID=Q22YX5_TETTS|nr:hypothetical protein TTHERM_00120960 [Tetrahymena thermophila SB210]EAR90546.3 hypothetical protein TTHERM_00120960 [Tetrahymena thermophila SB210]|eukprot:XP_001010791.3 hypothetical protein TTHERM_00120960 [Tetrahymena thermophila SB210]